jgi:two-component system, cell cycle response regulator
MGERIHGLGSRSSLLTIVTMALVVHVAHGVTGFGGEQFDSLFGENLYSAILLAGAAACVLRAVNVNVDSTAWIVLGAGLGAWGFGSILSSQAGAQSFPSIADGVALLLYPAVCVSTFLFVRGRIGKPESGQLLDAAIAVLGATAVGAVLLHNASPDLANPTQSASLMQAAFAGGDFAVVAALVAACALTGWRVDRAWTLVAIGLGAGALGDLAHTHHAGVGAHSAHAALTASWAVASLFVCFAAFEPPEPAAAKRTTYWRVLVLPMLFALAAAATIVYGRFFPSGEASLVLALLSLLGATVRPAVGFRENIRVLARSQQEALTDPLTGLGNRRSLMTDLREHVKAPERSSTRILVLFDLDGFKQYNDTFGHPAGDALLARLGANLHKAVGPYGGVYRMGGDEFCVLLTVGMASARTLTSIAAAALSERGEGFNIRSSYGAVMIPEEARDPALALKIADQRMYAQKEKRRPSTSRQTRDILLQVLRERDPELSDHMSAVGELSRRVGQRLKLLPEELDETVRAAELHDIGKMAIPDAILHKPGPLDEREWEFVHKHTIIGERILGAAPALVPVAKVVRSSHERWDGHGYPDGLAGEAIPVGARIVSVCDAYHAMTSSRPYGNTLDSEQGLSELRKAAGAEFDARVVDALCDVITESQGLPRRSMGPVAGAPKLA